MSYSHPLSMELPCSKNKISTVSGSLYCTLLFLCFLNTEELLLKNDVERVSFLTKRVSSVDEKDAHAKLGGNVSLLSWVVLYVCVYVSFFSLLTLNLQVTLSCGFTQLLITNAESGLHQACTGGTRHNSD